MEGTSAENKIGMEKKRGENEHLENRGENKHLENRGENKHLENKHGRNYRRNDKHGWNKG